MCVFLILALFSFEFKIKKEKKPKLYDGIQKTIYYVFFCKDQHYHTFYLSTNVPTTYYLKLYHQTLTQNKYSNSLKFQIYNISLKNEAFGMSILYM